MAVKPLVLEVLLALVDGPRHGWDLVGDVQSRLAGESILPGNFYRTLRRMQADGLIAEADSPQAEADERRRYFTLTDSGRRLARAEARRLQALINDRRVQRILKAR
jgi:PadR family transcriptional regulator, regulatory protein PadR